MLRWHPLNGGREELRMAPVSRRQVGRAGSKGGFGRGKRVFMRVGDNQGWKRDRKRDQREERKRYGARENPPNSKKRQMLPSLLCSTPHTNRWGGLKDDCGGGGGVYSAKTVLTELFSIIGEKALALFGGQVHHKVHCPFQAIIRAVKITPITFRTDFFCFFSKARCWKDKREMKERTKCGEAAAIKA